MAKEDTSHAGHLDVEAHGAFVRALASQVLGYGAAGIDNSNDVAQDTMLAAISSKHLQAVPATSIKGWLSRIVTRQAFRSRRLEGSRRYREEAYGRESQGRNPELDPAVQLLKGETIKTVTDAVLALSEPYLQTILLRFYEGKDPHEIGEMMGVPVATVRSRIQRAIAKLRTQLESEFGGSSQGLCLALAPLLQLKTSGWATAPAGAALIGKTTMYLKSKVVVSGVCLAAVLGLYASGMLALSSEQEQPTDNEPSKQTLVEMEASIPPSDTLQGRDQQPVRSKPLNGDPQSTASPKPRMEPISEGLFGHVYHEGKPLKGVAVVQYEVKITKLKDDMTGVRVIGHMPPVDRAVLEGQGGYGVHSAQLLDPGLDGPLPEGVRRYSEGRVVREPVVAMTDADGRFAFDRIATEAFALSMVHKELGLALQSEPILPKSVTVLDAGIFEIQRAATLHGTLVIDHALSLAGHEVEIIGMPGYSGASNAKGEFKIDSIPQGEYLFRVSMGPGVYRSDEGPLYFIRLHSGASRRITLFPDSQPSSRLTMQVTHNGKVVAGDALGSISLLVRETETELPIELDANGKGTVTVPSNVALQPMVQFESHSKAITTGTDVYATGREHFAKLDMQTGSLKLQIPSSCIPPMESCLVKVQTDIEGATAIRFDRLFGAEGHAVALDPGGCAEVRVPAWMSLEPSVQRPNGVWVGIQTLDVMFPTGEAHFQILQKPEGGGVTLLGHDKELRKKSNKRSPLYRLQIEWENPLNLEKVSTAIRVNPASLAAPSSPFQELELAGMPTGKIPIKIHLQHRSGHFTRNWKTDKTWTQSVVVNPGQSTTVPLTAE